MRRVRNAIRIAPRRGWKSRFALPSREAHPKAANGLEHTWLFFGARVLVASVSSELASLLPRACVFVGDRVLVATLPAKEPLSPPYLFCLKCGSNLMGKLHDPRNPHYVWDWIVDLEHQSLGTRWYLGLEPAPRRDSSS